MGQQDEGAARRAGFGLMKTILLPVEDHPSAESAIDTAVQLTLPFGRYVEGFALTSDPPLLVSADAFNGASITTDPDPRSLADRDHARPTTSPTRSRDRHTRHP